MVGDIVLVRRTRARQLPLRSVVLPQVLCAMRWMPFTHYTIELGLSNRRLPEHFNFWYRFHETMVLYTTNPIWNVLESYLILGSIMSKDCIRMNVPSGATMNV
jgi:hypothetical protein